MLLHDTAAIDGQGKKIQPVNFKAISTVPFSYRTFAIWKVTNVLLIGVYVNYNLIFFFGSKMLRSFKIKFDIDLYNESVEKTSSTRSKSSCFNSINN